MRAPSVRTEAKHTNPSSRRTLAASFLSLRQFLYLDPFSLDAHVVFLVVVCSERDESRARRTPRKLGLICIKEDAYE